MADTEVSEEDGERGSAADAIVPSNINSLILTVSRAYILNLIVRAFNGKVSIES